MKRKPVDSRNLKYNVYANDEIYAAFRFEARARMEAITLLRADPKLKVVLSDQNDNILPIE